MVVGLNVRQNLGQQPFYRTLLWDIVWVRIYCHSGMCTEIKSSTKSGNNSGKVVYAASRATSCQSKVKLSRKFSEKFWPKRTQIHQIRVKETHDVPRVDIATQLLFCKRFRLPLTTLQISWTEVVNVRRCRFLTRSFLVYKSIMYANSDPKASKIGLMATCSIINTRS